MSCFSASELRDSSLARSRAVSALRADGACVVQGLLSTELASRMVTIADESVTAGLGTLLSGDSADGDFSKIQGFSPAAVEGNADGAQLRLQRRLPLCPTVREAMQQALASLGHVLRVALGANAVLWELACLVANPGAPGQTFHRDAGEPDQAHAGLYSVFIALQDITCDMGPTLVIPRTHSNEAAAADPLLRSAEERYLSARERAIDSAGTEVDTGLLDAAERAARAFRAMNRGPLLRCGDALVYDSRLRHCGSANVSGEPRRLLNFGFAAAGADEAGLLQGHSSALVAELQGLCSLEDDPADWPRSMHDGARMRTSRVHVHVGSDAALLDSSRSRCTSWTWRKLTRCMSAWCRG